MSFGFDADAQVLRVSFDDAGAEAATEILIPPAAYPGGWQVATTEAEGAWDHSFDEATGVLSVTIPDTGATHTICVGPAGAELACSAT